MFTITLPESNVLGLEPGVAQAVSDGYSFIIAPPPPGTYEIATSAMYSVGPFANTVTLIVEAPRVVEPPAS